MILGYLSPPDVTAFGATCSRYHEQSQNRWVWKSVYTQALHYQQLGPARCLPGEGGCSCSQPSTSRAMDVPNAHGYQRVVPVRDHMLLWDYQGTLHLLKHDGAFPGSLSQHTVLCRNVMDFAVDTVSDAGLCEYVYVLRSPEYGPQEGPQDGPRGNNCMIMYHLGPEPELILRLRHVSQAFTQIRLTGSALKRQVLLLCDTGQVHRFCFREAGLHMAYLFRYEPMTTIVFNDPMASLPIRQVYSSQKSALYLSGDGTVHLEVYCTKLLKKMFGKREDLPALRTPVPLPLPTKVVKCSVGPAHLCLVDERGCIFTQGCNRSGQLGTGDRDDRTQLTEMAVSMMPVDVWCGSNYTLVLLKDESGHKELHGCGSGARGRLPGHPKGSNVLVKLNVQVSRAAHSICAVKDCLYIVSTHDITEP
ncbi:hypothetical protein CRUP_024002, partial [Coryphaenoides rupestris]